MIGAVTTEPPTGPKPEGTTDSAGRPSPALPPDPAEYDSPRAERARARGLSAPYIAGGRDPEPEVGRREERLYGRLLIAMVVTIIASGFVLGIVVAILTAGSR
jgi:hypothetical protein